MGGRDRPQATLRPEQLALHTTLIDAHSDRDATSHERIDAEMARYARGLSIITGLLWLHVIAEGTDSLSSCCTPAEGCGVVLRQPRDPDGLLG